MGRRARSEPRPGIRRRSSAHGSTEASLSSRAACSIKRVTSSKRRSRKRWRTGSGAHLGELRLRLGLVDPAEQTLAFGRKLVVTRSAPARAAQFELVAAQVARGATDVALHEVEAAMAHARLAGEPEFMAQAAIAGAPVGDHPLMRSLATGIKKAGRTDATVLIQGERAARARSSSRERCTMRARGAGVRSSR